MSTQIFTAIILLATFLPTYAETTTRIACPAQETGLDAQIVDLMNQAMLSAYASFEQNPAYSSANAEVSSVLISVPASVTSSLFCSGYGGIDINSLPTWLTPVPTTAVSMFLHEEQVYQSIKLAFEAKASRERSASSSTPESTITSVSSHESTSSSVSSHIITSGISVSASPTVLATPTSSSVAASTIARSISGSILVTVSVIIAGLL